MNGRGMKFWDFMREVNLIINQLIKLQLLVPTNTTLNNRQLLNLYHVPPKILGPYNENMTFHRLVRHKIENIVVIEIHPPPLASLPSHPRPGWELSFYSTYDPNPGYAAACV